MNKNFDMNEFLIGIKFVIWIKITSMIKFLHK